MSTGLLPLALAMVRAGIPFEDAAEKASKVMDDLSAQGYTIVRVGVARVFETLSKPVAVIPPAPPETPWVNEENVWDDFYEIRVTLNRPPSEEELDRVVGSIGYAARQHLRGENVGPSYDGEALLSGEFSFVVSYDITKSRSDDWLSHFGDFCEARASCCRCWRRRLTRPRTPVRPWRH